MCDSRVAQILINKLEDLLLNGWLQRRALAVGI
jgi:hypothetical protein